MGTKILTQQIAQISISEKDLAKALSYWFTKEVFKFPVEVTYLKKEDWGQTFKIDFIETLTANEVVTDES